MIAFAETQINSALLSNENYFKDNLFRSEVSNTIFVIVSHELIGLRQQDSVLASVRGEISKFCISSGSDSLDLGRWSWIDFQFPAKKVTMIAAHNCVNSRSTSAIKTVHVQQRGHSTSTGRNTCPRKAFNQGLEHFLR